MKTIKENGITYLLVPVSKVWEEHDYQNLCDCLAPSELDKLDMYVYAALQERGRKPTRGAKKKS